VTKKTVVWKDFVGYGSFFPFDREAGGKPSRTKQNAKETNEKKKINRPGKGEERLE